MIAEDNREIPKLQESGYEIYTDNKVSTYGALMNKCKDYTTYSSE